MNRLEAADRLAERLALLRVAQRRFVGPLREPDRQRGDANPPGIQDLHRVDEALSLLAKQLIGGNAAVVEEHLAGVARAHAELVFLLPGRHARRAVLDDERRDALACPRRDPSPPSRP